MLQAFNVFTRKTGLYKNHRTERRIEIKGKEAQGKLGQVNDHRQKEKEKVGANEQVGLPNRQLYMQSSREHPQSSAQDSAKYPTPMTPGTDTHS